MRIGPAVPEICSWTHTHTHTHTDTDRWVDHNTLHPYWVGITSITEIRSASAHLFVGTWCPPVSVITTVQYVSFFSSSSMLLHAFSALCMDSKFRHHPHPLGYLCAKFHFFDDLLHCWDSPRRKIAYGTQSLNHSPNLFNAPGSDKQIVVYQVYCVKLVLYVTSIVWSKSLVQTSIFAFAVFTASCGYYSIKTASDLSIHRTRKPLKILTNLNDKAHNTDTKRQIKSWQVASLVSRTKPNKNLTKRTWKNG